MPLTRSDAEYLLEQLYATAEVLGSEIKPAAATLMIRDLREHDRNEIERALARCRSEISGRLTLAAILERMPSVNAWLTPNEAWAVALEAEDESRTVIWTDEIARAAAAAKPIMAVGDKIGARMAFIAAYEREVDAAKERGRGPKWWPSLGDDKRMRREVIERGVQEGRLPAPEVKHALPAPDMPVMTGNGEGPARIREMVEELRRTLESNDEAARRRRQQEIEAEERRRAMLIRQAHDAMGESDDPGDEKVSP